MWKRFGLSWLAFWLGVVLAIIAWATISFKVGLLVFAVGFLLTIVLIVAGVVKGARKVVQFGHELEEEGRHHNAENSPAHPAPGRNIVTEQDAANGYTSDLRDRNIH